MSIGITSEPQFKILYKKEEFFKIGSDASKYIYSSDSSDAKGEYYKVILYLEAAPPDRLKDITKVVYTFEGEGLPSEGQEVKRNSSINDTFSYEVISYTNFKVNGRVTYKDSTNPNVEKEVDAKGTDVK